MTSADEILELTDEFYQHPHEVYEALRKRGPIHRVRLDGVLGWMIVDLDVAKQAFVEPSISKKIGSPQGQAVMAEHGADGQYNGAINDNMLFADPPQHTRLRSLVATAFASRAIRDLGPRIEQIADTLLDDLVTQDSVDLLDSYAFPVPISVICEMLGVPDADQDEFRAWTAVLVDDSADIEVRTSAGLNFFTYLTELIAERSEHPLDDLLSELIVAKDDDDRLDQQELISMLFLLLTAGHETAVNLIGNALLELLIDPRAADRLRADLSKIPDFIEETLRYQGPVHFGTARYTTAPITLGNQDIDAGEFIIISIAAANRDPKRFAEPGRFDADRSDNRNIAFGHGIHYCIGAALARMEATIALTRLLARIPAMSLDLPVNELTWRKSLLIRGLTTLPVRLSASDTAAGKYSATADATAPWTEPDNLDEPQFSTV
jgi:cytochrome P450